MDQYERVVLNFYVKPAEPVFSYLTELTGVKKEDVDAGISLEEATAALQAVLPSKAILVGQGILKGWQER